MPLPLALLDVFEQRLKDELVKGDVVLGGELSRALIQLWLELKKEVAHGLDRACGCLRGSYIYYRQGAWFLKQTKQDMDKCAAHILEDAHL